MGKLHSYLEPTYGIVSGKVNSLHLAIVADESFAGATASLEHVEPDQYLVSLISKYPGCFDGQLCFQPDVLLELQVLLLCGSCRLVEYPKTTGIADGQG